MRARDTQRTIIALHRRLNSKQRNETANSAVSFNVAIFDEMR